jgi:hypothetical protein
LLRCLGSILIGGEPGSLAGIETIRIRQAMGIPFRYFAVESEWRDETLRTNLWLLRAAESVAAVLLFVVTLSVDHTRGAPRRGRAT